MFKPVVGKVEVNEGGGNFSKAVNEITGLYHCVVKVESH